MKTTYTVVWHGKYYAVGYYNLENGNLCNVSFHEKHIDARLYADKKNGNVWNTLYVY